jgi:hypothetical protein
MTVRRRPIYASDLRSLGGIVGVVISLADLDDLMIVSLAGDDALLAVPDGRSPSVGMR